MKNYGYRLSAILILVGLVFMQSCYKQQGCTDPNGLNYSATAVIDDGSCIYGGCTDPDSKNYNPRADVDDGSCSFEGSVVFWYDESTSEGLMYYGVTSLTYYFDGEIVGSSAANVYWTGAPDCGQTGSVTVEKDLGNIKTQPYSYRVIDQTGFEVWEGIVNLKANTCIQFELRGGKKKSIIPNDKS